MTLSTRKMRYKKVPNPVENTVASMRYCHIPTPHTHSHNTNLPTCYHFDETP